MKPKKSYAEYLKDWRHLEGLIASDPNLAGTTAAQRREALATVVEQVDELLQQQSIRDAEKQATSQQIRQLIVQGRELVRDMKLELKGSLGARAIGLVKFRLKPLGESQQTKKAEREAASTGALSSGKEPGATPVSDPAANVTPKPSPA
jgi:hypothetical protein